MFCHRAVSFKVKLSQETYWLRMESRRAFLSWHFNKRFWFSNLSFFSQIESIEPHAQYQKSFFKFVRLFDLRNFFWKFLEKLAASLKRIIMYTYQLLYPRRYHPCLKPDRISKFSFRTAGHSTRNSLEAFVSVWFPPLLVLFRQL